MQQLGSHQKNNFEVDEQGKARQRGSLHGRLESFRYDEKGKGVGLITSKEETKMETER